MIQSRIEELLTEKFKEEDFRDCYQVEIKIQNNNKVQVFFGSDSGVTFKKCQKISRYLENFIEEENLLPEKYILEVSSPGLNSPLKLKRQYANNVGRKLALTLEGGEKMTGILKTVIDDKIVIEYKVRIKEGKKKKTEIIEKEIPLSNIVKGFVKPEF